MIHTHTEADIAVGALEEGLLPLSQWAMRFYGRLGYHDYEGVSLDLDERERLQASIGQNPVLVLRNHGLLATGRNVAEAFSSTYHFERSAAAQLKIQAAAASGCQDRDAAGRDLRAPVPPCSRNRATRPGSAASANGPPCCASSKSSIRVSGDRGTRRRAEKRSAFRHFRRRRPAECAYAFPPYQLLRAPARLLPAGDRRA